MLLTVLLKVSIFCCFLLPISYSFEKLIVRWKANDTAEVNSLAHLDILWCKMDCLFLLLWPGNQHNTSSGVVKCCWIQDIIFKNVYLKKRYIENELVNEGT